MFNVDFEFEVIPIADYDTKVSLALNTGTNAPDVILYQSTKGENASLALNGALVPISDYVEYTPNFNSRVEEFGLTEVVNDLNLADGKRYYLPSLFDVPFYDMVSITPSPRHSSVPLYPFSLIVFLLVLEHAQILL